MSQPLPEAARRILGVDEGRFTEVVRELARNALLYQCSRCLGQLEEASITLGYARPSRRVYTAVARIPLCARKRGSSLGVLGAAVAGDRLVLVYRCAAGRKGKGKAGTVDVAYVFSGEVVAYPPELYKVYSFLYKELGTGAEPLLALAREARAKGNRKVAKVLKNLYLLLEASRSLIREFRRRGYSSVRTAVADEVERMVGEAVGLLRKAKGLAERGDAEGLARLMDELLAVGSVFDPMFRVSLGDVIHYLETGNLYPEAEEEFERMFALRFLLNHAPKDPDDMLRKIDIYSIFIIVAGHLGLEVIATPYYCSYLGYFGYAIDRSIFGQGALLGRHR